MSFTKIIQSSRETFTYFFHRLTSSVNRVIIDPDEKQLLILNVAFENTNADIKNVLEV